MGIWAETAQIADLGTEMLQYLNFDTCMYNFSPLFMVWEEEER